MVVAGSVKGSRHRIPVGHVAYLIGKVLRFERLFPAPEDRHRGSGAGQRFRCFGADTGSAAGDNDMFAGKCHTRIISASRSARRHAWSRPARYGNGQDVSWRSPILAASCSVQ